MILPSQEIHSQGYFVYVIGSTEGKGIPRTYVGWTTDLERRLKQHNDGKGARSTKGRQWSLLHWEGYGKREEAMSREQILKRDRKARSHFLSHLKLGDKCQSSGTERF